jgi:heavy metal translocating P-type ATPase
VRRHPLPIVAATGLVTGLAALYLARVPDVATWVFLATLVIGGLPVVLRTAANMLRGQFAADIVAALAIAGAAVTGEYAAGCVIVLMQTGGETLEAYAVGRASASLEELLRRAPRVANRRRSADPKLRNGALEVVPVEDLVVGESVMVRPGEIIPVDGVVEAGTAAVDEAALTGEPIPRPVKPGLEVMGGSICLDGVLDVRVIRPSSESQYDQIVRLVRAAQTQKAPIGRLADRYAVLFTPFTLLMCVAAYVITHQPVAVVAVLVVATPCPLILATPVAIISGINRAARLGVIVKSGAAIERVGRAKVVVFDKTGTLTRGSPTVDRVVSLDGYSAEEILWFGSGPEQGSTHPMARALVAAAAEFDRQLPTAEDIHEAPGQGVWGKVAGRRVDVGSFAHAAAQGISSPDALAAARSEANAKDDAIALVAIDGRAAGLVVFSDPIRPAIPQLLARLERLGVRETVMLTGDDRATAQIVASEAGIDTVKAQLLPADKATVVEELSRRYDTVVMVGDGINDAPALATATVGIALGARGAAVAAETADIVITTDDVGRVADAIETGRRTLRIALQSIWIGLGVSSGLMVVAAFGYIAPAGGAVLQELLDVAVILNALRAR